LREAFPGLGQASLDPHLNLPTIPLTWEDMEKVHLVPFMRAMRTAVHSIMTSHPLYPNLDPTPRTPATFSRKIVHDYLRQKVGYKGVIFSDDLEMERSGRFVLSAKRPCRRSRPGMTSFCPATTCRHKKPSLQRCSSLPEQTFAD